jgi:hypothetical protein
LREHGVAGDQHVAQLDLLEERQGLGELILPLADGQLRQHRSATAGEGTQQVATGQRLGLGPTHRLAIDGDRLERHGRGELGR